MLITSHFIMFHVCFSFLPLLCAALVVVAVVAFAVAVTLLVVVAHVYFDIFYYRTSLFLPFPFAACRLPAMCLFLFRVRRQHGLSRRRSRVGELEPSPGPATGPDIIMMVILMSVTNFLHDLLSATIPPFFV